MKHWVFDLDGTLVDSFPSYFEILETVFARQGVEFKVEYRLPALTHHLPDFFEQHLGSAAVSNALKYLDDQSSTVAHQVKPFAGVMDSIRHLKTKDSKIAVWTNREFASADLILKHTGLSEHVEYLVSGTCVERKPSTEGLEKIISRFACDPKEITMVGDHEHDVAAGKKLGTRSIRASWHPYWKMDPCSIADHQFHDFQEFQKFIRK